ncbi:MAG: N-hydroxyarylamine O-acetyltransferase [Planctomycetota bacterium]|jgi:N-hydroxyarylamine O-acetyltransferase
MVTVKNYLDRLQFSSAPSIDANGLSKLHERHLLTIPFENADIYIQKPISLEIEAILDKVVNRRRGGFCYELNGAFAWLLKELGFTVHMLEANVTNDAGEFGIPFDHAVLRVDFDKPYLVDVGFGRGFLNPLEWEYREEVRERGGKWQLRDDKAGGLLLETFERKSMRFKPVYRVNPGRWDLKDFGEGCEYHQTSPDSPFTGGLICTIAAPDGRVTIRDSVLVIERNGRREETPLADDDALAREVRRYFGFSLGDVENK